jgi:hypothetical protein
MGAPPDPGGDASGAGGGKGLRDPNKQGGGGEERCRPLWNRLRKIDETIAALEKDLEKLQPPQPDEPGQPKEENPVEEPMPDVLWVWGHDLTIKPGRTYRYRCVVEVFNPLFAHKIDLMPEQQGLADQFTIASESSEWSPPVLAEPPLHVFITKANPAASAAGIGNVPLGSAIAEVFRFYNGQWWFEDFTVRPGDRVGQKEAARDRGEGDQPAQTIDFTTDWFVLDVVEDIAADKADTDLGRAALVVLQSLSAPDLTQYRSPRDEAQSEERDRLMDQVQATGQGALASASNK